MTGREALRIVNAATAYERARLHVGADATLLEVLRWRREDPHGFRALVGDLGLVQLADHAVADGRRQSSKSPRQWLRRDVRALYAAGLQQTEIARRCKVSEATVSRWVHAA